MARSVLLLLLTVILVVFGCVLYAMTYIGWAQICLVFASGTAGATVVAILDDHDRRGR